MMKRRWKLLIITGVLIFAQFLIPVKQTEAGEPSAAFIVDFSESMGETLGEGETKIDRARGILFKVLDNFNASSPIGIVLIGHRDKDACDDIELVVITEETDRDALKTRLTELVPKGKSLCARALKETVEKFKDDDNILSIVFMTDGNVSCEGDLISTARELKERYDYNLYFHVIGLNPQGGNNSKLVQVAWAGYGTFHPIRARSGRASQSDKTKQFIIDRRKTNVDNIVQSVTENLKNPFMHTPKAITNDEMVLIPAGTFTMGGSPVKKVHPNEHPRHEVYLDAFYIDKYEVTQRQYREVMGDNPSIWIGSDLPVDRPSWFEAKEYCEKVGKRLPTEAEWEKAAKGGRDDIWAGTSDREKLEEYVWCDDTGAEIKTHPVGLKKPNGYGLYDMSGNVQEWVSDWFGKDYYKTSPKENPQGPEHGVSRVLRGGNWDSHTPSVRTTFRYGDVSETKHGINGFRCAKSEESE
jgi:formylglycine-generating enzyme required for sulfatase activity